MASRIVEIKRIFTGRQDRLYPESKKCIGAVMTKNGETATGLTFEETRKYMPGIVNVDHTEFNFRAKVDDYFKSLTLRPEKEGMKFEIGTDENGNPLNVTQYVQFKFALQNPKVAAAQEKILHGISHFVVVDKEKELDANQELLQKRRDAYKEFILLMDDEKKLAIVLSLLAGKLGYGIVQIRNADKREVQQKLEKYVLDNPLDFYELVKDKHISVKAFIEDCVSAGALNRVGTALLNGDLKIGNTVEEAVLFLTDKANSEIFVTLKARVDEFKKVATVKS